MAQVETGTDHLLARIEGGIGHITLNRPQARNAMSGEMTSALAAVLENFDALHCRGWDAVQVDRFASQAVVGHASTVDEQLVLVVRGDHHLAAHWFVQRERLFRRI